MPNDIQKIRRENLRRLIDKYGATELAKRLGYSSHSYLSQLAGAGKHTRLMGEKTARDIEEKLGLERWALDRPPGSETPFAGTDRALLADVMRAVQHELDGAALKLDPRRQANLVAEVYEKSVPLGRVDQDYLKRLLDLLT